MLTLTTPDFENGRWIPEKNSGYGEDRSPGSPIEEIDPKVKTVILTRTLPNRQLTRVQGENTDGIRAR